MGIGERNTNYSRIEEEITDFISGKVKESYSKGVVIGLSGGIDSTTVAYCAVEALGQEKVHGFVLPSSANRNSNIQDAKDVAQELGIELTEINIDPIVNEFSNAAPDPIQDKLTFGNLQVRIRAVILYMYANLENKIVLGTGNKSESLMGYFTKYGDQAVDINPIGDLYKTEVREFARHLEVPERIISKKPSAGMWEEQEDEEDLGVSYETADNILYYLIDEDVDLTEIAKVVDCSEKDIAAVYSHYQESEHKRSMPPTPNINF